MDLTKPSVVHRLLGEAGVRLRRELGQNFLVDPSALGRILEAADIGREDVLLEIGSGIGTLTRPMAESARWIFTVEKDPRLLPLLRRSLEEYGNVEIFHADFRSVDLPGLLEKALKKKGPAGRLKVVSTPPYYATKPILRKLLEEGRGLREMVLALQEEVAHRIVAEPGGRDYGLLSLLVRYYAEAEVTGRIARGCFFPPPLVDSAIVRFRIRAEPAVEVGSPESLFRLMRIAFSKRRKMLQNALQSLGGREKVREALERAGIDPRLRAENLSLEDFARLYRSFFA